MKAGSKIRILENLCRTCMGKEETAVIITATRQNVKSLISIYNERETKDSGRIKIMELLKQSCPQLTVKTDDILPKNICESCLDMLENIHDFQKKSLKVELRLQSIIKEHYPSHEIYIDPLNNNILQSGGGNDIQIDIDEPLIDVTAPGRRFFTLVQKDGQVIEVYNALEKCGKDKSELSEKSDIEDDTATSETRDNENVKFWKYIEGDYKNQSPVKKNQNRKGEVFANDELNINKHGHERGGKHSSKRTRILRKSKRYLGMPKEINNRQQKCDDDDIDSEMRHDPTIPLSTDMKEVAEGDSLESEVSDFNETGGKQDSECELALDKSETLKTKSIKNATNKEGNRQDNLDLKGEDKNLASVKLDTQRFPCNVCGKRLKTVLGLKSHLKRHLKSKNKQKQQNAENGHICPECGARLKTRVTFRRHLLLMHEKDETKIKYKCQYCNKVFCQSSTLRCHERLHTGERPYLCSICGKSFSTQYSLNQHNERHGTEFNYQCPKCPKRFSSSSSMSTHKATVHSKVRPHVCDVCGASFKRPWPLRIHKIIHGEKKHKCDYCEMKFAVLDQCRRHMRTHTGEKPYKCRYCERAYAQSNDMIKHLRVHLGDNVYRCEMCPQAFRLLCELRAHFTSHKDDDEQTKFQNLKALKEEEERIQAKIERSRATEQQS